MTGPRRRPKPKYLVVLTIVTVSRWIAKIWCAGASGRSWMAIRDMDIAAELIGIRPLPAKLLAFAISSYYCGSPARCSWCSCG